LVPERKIDPPAVFSVPTPEIVPVKVVVPPVKILPPPVKRVIGSEAVPLKPSSSVALFPIEALPEIL
jgi:hypothetical protein